MKQQTTSTHRMKHYLVILSLLAALASPLVLTGCGEGHAQPVPVTNVNPQVGKNVRVHFRRDLLGTFSSIPVGPLVNDVDSYTISIFGRLKIINADWVVLAVGAEEYWIPRSVVLVIDVFGSLNSR